MAMRSSSRSEARDRARGASPKNYYPGQENDYERHHETIIRNAPRRPPHTYRNPSRRRTTSSPPPPDQDRDRCPQTDRRIPILPGEVPQRGARCDLLLADRVEHRGADPAADEPLRAWAAG